MKTTKTKKLLLGIGTVVLALCLAVVLLVIYQQNKRPPFVWPKSEELEAMSDSKLLTELMDYGLTYMSGYSSGYPPTIEEACHENFILRELLSRPGGAERLVNFYHHWAWLWPERREELRSLFQTNGFREAIGQEEYDRLFLE